MRISDWSSDVCSSDLPDVGDRFPGQPGLPRRDIARGRIVGAAHRAVEVEALEHRNREFEIGLADIIGTEAGQEIANEPARAEFFRHVARHFLARSEEHTSELQSLMRISYAVFCLKKKKYKKSSDLQRHNTHTYQLYTYNN